MKPIIYTTLYVVAMLGAAAAAGEMHMIASCAMALVLAAVGTLALTFLTLEYTTR